jgi:hypothetical protein
MAVHGHEPRAERHRPLASLPLAVSVASVMIVAAGLPLSASSARQESKPEAEKPAAARPQAKALPRAQGDQTGAPRDARGVTAIDSAKPIVGHVERPDGSPAKGVSILAYSLSRMPKRDKTPESDSSFRTKTDDMGKFEINVWSAGPAVFWILPDDLAGEPHFITEVRALNGQLGRYRLTSGVLLKGRVLDMAGKPIAGIFVNAERLQYPEDREIFKAFALETTKGPAPRRAYLEALFDLMRLRGLHPIARTAITADDGTFALAPLAAGRYRVSPGDRASDGSDRRLRPLTDVFTVRSVSLKEQDSPEFLEIRPSPHVLIEAQWLDGKGKPVIGFQGYLIGTIDGSVWSCQTRIDKATGKVVAQVPDGLENAKLGVMTGKDRAFRWRKAKGEPLHRSRTIALGTLDHDVKGIEIVEYKAPTVIVKAETNQNTPVPGLKVSAHYTEEDSGHSENELILPGGVRSDVRFEKQKDGRFRSEQLQPGLGFVVIAEADGFKPASRRLTLAEGTTEEITVMLGPWLGPRAVKTTPPRIAGKE